MGKEVHQLSARFLETVSEPGQYADGGNLYLVVTPTGAKSWRFIFKKDGKRREAGLGKAGKSFVGLADARQKAADARRLLAEGKDPIEAKKAAQAAQNAPSEIATFGAFAVELLEGVEKEDAKGRTKKVGGLVDGFRNEKHRAQWTSTLRMYAKPIWSKALTEVEVDDIVACLSPIWLTKQETASRVRGRIEKVLSAAIARKLRPGPNPAMWRDNLDALLPKRRKLQRGNHPAMPFGEIGDFWPRLAALESVSARALAFTILTAARSGEVRGATWAEFDFDAKVWTVPAKRMKAGREHAVPLSEPVLAILAEVAQLAPEGADRRGAIVFPSRKGTALSDMAILECVRGLAPGYTTHGFRSTFRDWAGDLTSFPREVVEEALAHQVGNATERAYRRSRALEKRRELMAAWARYVCGEKAEVVAIDGARLSA